MVRAGVQAEHAVELLLVSINNEAVARSNLRQLAERSLSLIDDLAGFFFNQPKMSDDVRSPSVAIESCIQLAVVVRGIELGRPCRRIVFDLELCQFKPVNVSLDRKLRRNGFFGLLDQKPVGLEGVQVRHETSLRKPS